MRKRLGLAVVAVVALLALVVVVYAGQNTADYDLTEKPHGVRVITDTDFPKWIIGTAADTSEQFDTHLFNTFAHCWSIDVSQTSDSGVVKFEWQLSLDGSNWYSYESKTFADDDTAFQFHKWTLAPALYSRMVITGVQGTNDSAYVKDYNIILQQ